MTEDHDWPVRRPHVEPAALLWVRVAPEDGNCDQLPAWLTPKEGCPACGSVWVDVQEAGCSSICRNGSFVPERWYVQQVGAAEPIRAVRLGCSNGHLVEFDGRSYTVVPMWGGLMLAASMAAGLVWFTYGLCSRKKAGP